jgi:hypothetical protein
MMASDDKKIKTNPAPNNETPPKNKSTSGVDPSKAEGGEIAAALPSGYSRGEGQKPVSKAYKENWNAIFATKKNDKLTSSSARNLGSEHLLVGGEKMIRARSR